jgi:hypothetical protein
VAQIVDSYSRQASRFASGLEPGVVHRVDAVVSHDRLDIEVLHGRSLAEGKTHNFPAALPEHLAEHAEEALKSRYNLEFLGIGRAVREPNDPAAQDPRGRADRQDTLTTRDYVVGAAHAAQLAGVGGPAMHGATQAIGTADAAKLALDAANGKDVRAADAAAAAASVTLASDAGGPAIQTAAKIGAAAGAADTVRRALNTADAAEPQPAEGTEAQADPDERQRLQLARARAIPDSVAERFLNVDDRYYFPDKTLAFTDRGTKLSRAPQRELEGRLIERLRDFILELGYGFCFIGRQHRLVLGRKDYFIDLLFYHRFLKALVAIEMKVGGFEPAHVPASPRRR